MHKLKENLEMNWNTLEKIDNLTPLTIHLLLRYAKGIALNLPKFGKASKISGDLRRSPEIVASFRKCSGIFGNIRPMFENLPNFSDGFVWSSEVFG